MQSFLLFVIMLKHGFCMVNGDYEDIDESLTLNHESDRTVTMEYRPHPVYLPWYNDMSTDDICFGLHKAEISQLPAQRISRITSTRAKRFSYADSNDYIRFGCAFIVGAAEDVTLTLSSGWLIKCTESYYVDIEEKTRRGEDGQVIKDHIGHCTRRWTSESHGKRLKLETYLPANPDPSGSRRSGAAQGGHYSILLTTGIPYIVASLED